MMSVRRIAVPTALDSAIVTTDDEQTIKNKTLVDIVSMSMTTPLGIASGGTGCTSLAEIRTLLGLSAGGSSGSGSAQEADGITDSSGVASSDMPINITSNAIDGNTANMFGLYASACTTSGDVLRGFLGTDSTNSATVGYRYNGSASDNSNFTIGLQSAMDVLMVYGNRSVGINTSRSVAPGYDLLLANDSAAKPGSGGLWSVISDQRVKQNIADANLAMCYDTVKRLRLRRFEWNPKYFGPDAIRDRTCCGFIAQEVQQVLPKAVTVRRHIFNENTSGTDGVQEEEIIDDLHAINNDQIIMASFGALQLTMYDTEQNVAQIDLLKDRVAQLESQNALLQTEVAKNMEHISALQYKTAVYESQLATIIDDIAALKSRSME